MSGFDAKGVEDISKALSEVVVQDDSIALPTKAAIEENPVAIPSEDEKMINIESHVADDIYFTDESFKMYHLFHRYNICDNDDDCL
jgi:hypothetical protein